MLTKANLHFSDWITWNGGDCPVDDETMVEVEFRDGVRCTDTGRWWEWSYGDEHLQDDIIAYRVVKKTKFCKEDAVTLVSGPASEMKVIGVHVYEDGSVVYRCVDQQEQWDYFSESQLCKFVPKENDVLSEGEGWIKWDGGKCPVDPDTMVEVEFRNGKSGVSPAECWMWWHGTVASDIIAYRVAEPHTTETNDSEDEVIEIKMTIGEFRKLLTESVKQVLKEHLDNR